MIFPSPLHRRLLAPALAFLALASSTQALPPAAPTNVEASVSLRVSHSGNLIVPDKYLITWDDNAIDETGYRVDVRLGNVGPFSTLGFLAPNQEGFLWTPPAFFAVPSQFLQFQVIAYKYNGASVVTRSGPIRTVTYPNVNGAISAPTGLTAEALSDGKIRLAWNNPNSNGETYHQVFYKKATDTNWDNASYFYLEQDRHEVVLQSGARPPSKLPHLLSGARANAVTHFAPGTAYHFIVRAVVRLNQDENNYHNATTTREIPFDSDFFPTLGSATPVAVTMPALSAPTNLQGSVVDQTSIRLRWVDNSDNESGHKIEYKAINSSIWQSLSGLAPANSTQYVVNTGSGVTLDWRVSAVYNDPVSGSTVATSTPSNEYPLGTTFPGPGNLTATDTGYEGTILLEWEDNAEAETNYEIFARVKDDVDEEWKYVTTLAANARRANVTQAAFDDSNLTDFPKDVELEFLVEAVIYLRDSNGNVIDRAAAQSASIASAIPRDGFTSRPYHPIAEGYYFTYQVTTSNEENRESWSVAGLPEGLGFDESTGEISGTPTERGYFPCAMSATFTDGHTATAILNLRVLPASSLPQPGTTIQDITLAPALQYFLPLADKFTDDDSQAAARLRTTLGDIDILLYPDLAPESVQNFLHYVNNGTYNGVIIHRSVPDFIIQGGSYRAFQAPNYFVRLNATRPSPVNEPGISNLRGTVAWAKLPGTADSATLDFFFNLGDNSENLDNQNEGFAAFGRVAGNGMTLVDAIAAKPVGSYRNFNSSGGTNTSLDKRVNLVEFSGGTPFLAGKEALEAVPMNTDEENAPLDMDVNQAFRILQAGQILPLGYSVTANTAPDVVSAFVSGGSLVIQSLKEGSAGLTVQAADLDGNLTSQSFTVNVVRNYKAPVIKKHPVPVAVLPGAAARLTVSATGTGPLQYQWMKDGQDLPGETTPRLDVPGVDESKTGEYAVRVWNDSLSVRSNIARIDLRAPPAFTTHPEPKVVEAGQPLELEVNGTGAPLPKFVWLRSGRTVPKQTAPKLSIPSAKLADGGIYTVRASNVAAKNVTSNPAEVIVVDKSSKLAFAPAGRRLALQAQAAGGPGMLYQWLKDGALLVSETDNIKGVNGPVLTINALNLGDNGGVGNYTCRIASADTTLTAETGPWKVGIAQKPVLQNFTIEPAYVGLEYDQTPPFGGDNNNSVVTFNIKGLPRGMKYDTATARIFGTTSLPGVYPLTVTGRNPAGTSDKVTGTLLVMPMPEPAVGTFAGQIAASETINGSKGGRVDFTVTDGGLVSGKITQGKEVLSFKGTMSQTAGSSFAIGQALITRRGKSPLAFSFATVAVQGFVDSGNFEGVLTDGVASAEVAGFRKVFHPAWNPYGLPQSYNIGLNLPEDSVGDDEVPQGSGYLRVTTNVSGMANVTGRLADGTSFTSSSPLGGVLAGGQNIRFLVYQSLYKHTGAIVGEPSILILPLAPAGVNDFWFRVAGQLLWKKDAQASAKERGYKEGFGPVILDALGMTYTPPASSATPALDFPIIFRLPRSSQDNAVITFEHGGLEEALTNPNVPVLTINNANNAVIPAAGNPGGVKLSITPSTGLLSGSFTLDDDPEIKPKRTATFNGLVIPQIPDFQVQQLDEFGNPQIVDIPGATAQGVGHFLLAQKPSAGPPATTIKTSPILSGAFLLKPAPIAITQQPQPATVDPNDSHIFTVAATAPSGTLAYQWRFKGTSISGANSDNLVLNAISESNEGLYDVVITTEFSRIVSAPALLTVNNPVSSVIISRSPADEVVDEGTQVVFTATAEGDGELSYQWRRNAEDIEGATSSTYVIQSVTAGDSGEYAVRVSSALTPAGVVSNVVSLDVATGVTNPLLSRLPSDEELSIGRSVTFEVIPDGKPPHNYTWLKDGVFIDDADNAPTFTIPFVSLDSAGTYTVLVSNALTPDGVLTNGVPLAVNTRVGDVTAIRQPEDVAVPESTRVDMTVSNTGLGPFTYQWYKDDVLIDGATSVTFTLDAALEADSGDYTVRVFNDSTPDGELSNVVELVVARPVINVTASLTHPIEGVITEGGSVEITASADGTGPLFFQWFKDGTEIDGATGIKLTLSDVTSEDDGEYVVRVSNAVSDGEFSNGVAVQVQSDP